jgi:hypothetical protein
MKHVSSGVVAWILPALLIWTIYFEAPTPVVNVTMFYVAFLIVALFVASFASPKPLTLPRWRRINGVVSVVVEIILLASGGWFVAGALYTVSTIFYYAAHPIQVKKAG